MVDYADRDERCLGTYHGTPLLVGPAQAPNLPLQEIPLYLKLTLCAGRAGRWKFRLPICPSCQRAAPAGPDRGDTTRSSPGYSAFPTVDGAADVAAITPFQTKPDAAPAPAAHDVRRVNADAERFPDPRRRVFARSQLSRLHHPTGDGETLELGGRSIAATAEVENANTRPREVRRRAEPHVPSARCAKDSPSSFNQCSPPGAPGPGLGGPRTCQLSLLWSPHPLSASRARAGLSLPVPILASSR